MADCCNQHQHQHTTSDQLDSAAHAHKGNEHPCCSAQVIVEPRQPAPVFGAADRRSAFRILQMDCPTEEALIRKKLAALPGVKHLEFNLLQRLLTVVHAPGVEEEVLAALRSLGFQPEATDTSKALPPAQNRHPTWQLALAGAGAVASEITHWAGLPTLVSAVLAVLAVLACGLSTYKKGWIAIRNGNLNINALMSIAVTGALALGQWPEAAMVMVLFRIAELLEAKSLDRARQAIDGLLQLAPQRATVQQPDGSWQELVAADIALGSLLRVRPGERIALDGQVVSGYSSVNQAPITGESLPVEKSVGDPVFAGTINEAGAFEYRATAKSADSTLARIIQVVEQAQGAKAPTQGLVDRFARVYTPLVVTLALAVALLPPLFGAQPWYPWIYKALVLLVIACPCALVIATPVSIVSALAAAARQGILIKGGVYLEEARNLAWLVLDKTGTLTQGKPVQTDFQVLGDLPSATCLNWAASLAQRSDHPVSRAISLAASAVQVALAEVDHFEALPGRGVKGQIGGQTYWLGNRSLLNELGLSTPTLAEQLDRLEQQGKTLTLLLRQDQVLALFAVADTLKDGSRAAITALHQLGFKTLLLSGDNPRSTEAIANQLGIDRALGNQLPEDKLRAVEALAKQGKVGMVGDGINDAPALARAHIGLAMGIMGSDTAIETADVTLMDDDLGKLVTFIRLSQFTYRVLRQNIVLAIAIKLVFLLLTLMGLGNMWMAVFADVGASLLVVGNGLRLLRPQRPLPAS